MSFARVVAAATLCVAFSSAPVWAQQQPGPRGADDPLVQAMNSGDYERARSLSLRHDDTPSLVVRARLAEMKGKFEEARRFASVANDRATSDSDRELAGVLVARYQRAAGDLAGAEATLREIITANTNAHGARFELGDLLLGQGKTQEGREVLEPFSGLFNGGVIKDPDDLVYLARAMQLLDSFDDANYAFEGAIKANPKHVEALVRWGELLLSKYNIADAQRSFAEALQVNANHPGALVGMAAIEMMTSNQSDKAREFLAKAEAVAPRDPNMLLARSHMALRDSDCPRAVEHAQAIIEVQPKHLEALTIVATCHYLEDEPEAFDASVQAILALNPVYADLYSTVGTYGVRAHRYVGAMDLFRAGIALDPGHAESLMGLGTGLSRIGKEDEAVEYLQKAFDADPYNVRAYNMVELYDKALIRYEFMDHGRFRVRAHKDQRAMIDQIVAPVVADSMDTFDRKYDFEPHEYLAVEIFPDTTTFSVRSVGLPNISPHGICFGRVVTVRSPSDGNFNWAKVLWHEMAHVYHIQLSDGRVPRWFTEGLAEYETNVKDPAWLRHHDREIAIKLFADGMPSVLNFNRGFTHAKSLTEVVRSYHLASLAIHYIADTHGFDSIPAMLRSWGDRKRTVDVLAEVLGVTVQEFDAGFDRWLRYKYMNFEKLLLVSLDDLGSIEELEKKHRRNERDAVTLAKLALVRAQLGQRDEAIQAIRTALSIAPKDAWVNYAAMFVRLREGKPGEALMHGEAVLDDSRDAFMLRILMGIASLQSEKLQDAFVHFHSATQLYPDSLEAWTYLEQISEKLGEEDVRERALERIYELNDGDPDVASARATRYFERGDYAEAFVSVKRWLDVNPFDVRSQRMRIKVARKLGKLDEIELGYRAMIATRTSDKKDILLEAIRDFSGMGEKARADAFADVARDEGVDADAIEAARSGK